MTKERVWFSGCSTRAEVASRQRRLKRFRAYRAWVNRRVLVAGAVALLVVLVSWCSLGVLRWR